MRVRRAQARLCGRDARALRVANLYPFKPINGEGIRRWDLHLISNGELGCNHLDSRFRGNDGAISSAR